MSLPTFGPTPTHAPLPVQQLEPLVRDLMSKAQAELTHAAMAEVADAAGVPASHAYVAAGMAPTVRFEREHDIAFVVCSGGCQRFGALELLEKLLEVRDRRLAASEPAFDVHTRGCLNGCFHAPLVQVQTPEGVGHLAKATPANIEEALASLLD